MGGGGFTGQPITKLNTLRGLADKRIRELEESEQAYDLFIPHSWKYESDYENLKKLLDGVDDFNFRDYSIPRDDPIDAHSKAELYQALENQIKTASVVVIPAGMYARVRSDRFSME